MATMTHESPATQPVHLSSSQRELATRISKAQTGVNRMEEQIREAKEKLQAAVAVYNEACRRLARGEDVDVVAAKGVISKWEAKISGLQALLSEPRQLLDDLRRELSDEKAREDEAKQSVAVLDEQDLVQQQIDQAMRSISERDRHQQVIQAAISHLRSRSYLTGTNKKAGFDGAYAVERRASGLLN